MDKIAMRDWIASLEEDITLALFRWKKLIHNENGDTVRLVWQFENYLMIVDIDWHDQEERVKAQLNGSHRNYFTEWAGLNPKTSRYSQERIRTWATGIITPPIDPMDLDG